MEFTDQRVCFDELGSIFNSDVQMLFELQAAGVVVDEPVSILFEGADDELVTQLRKSFSPLYYRRMNDGWNRVVTPDNPDFVLIYDEGTMTVNQFQDVTGLACEHLDEEQHPERLFPEETPVVFVIDDVSVPLSRFDLVSPYPPPVPPEFEVDPYLSYSYPRSSVEYTVTGTFDESDFEEFYYNMSGGQNTWFNIGLRRFSVIMAGLYSGVSEVSDDVISHAASFREFQAGTSGVIESGVSASRRERVNKLRETIAELEEENEDYEENGVPELRIIEHVDIDDKEVITDELLNLESDGLVVRPSPGRYTFV